MWQLPPEIDDDLKEVAFRLEALGFSATQSTFSASFGDYFVDLVGRGRQLRIVRDRSQYFVDADRDDLERAGLWRTFEDRDEFLTRLLTWLSNAKESP